MDGRVATTPLPLAPSISRALPSGLHFLDAAVRLLPCLAPYRMDNEWVVVLAAETDSTVSIL